MVITNNLENCSNFELQIKSSLKKKKKEKKREVRENGVACAVNQMVVKTYSCNHNLFQSLKRHKLK